MMRTSKKGDTKGETKGKGEEGPIAREEIEGTAIRED